MYRADTIVACATAAGRGAIAIVRCSGRDARRIADHVFSAKIEGPLEVGRVRLGCALAADGHTPVDEVLALWFAGPHSFTGEDVLELHCHGSPVVVELLIASMIAAGARSAERGEFSRRAVLNGKLDLLQAEAVADLIDAKMAAGARAAWKQLQGALSDEFAAVRSDLVAVLAQIEADVDFTDDELPAADFGHRSEALCRSIARLEGLLDGFAASRRQREGLRVVFTGKPNAGKSSLVNRLLGTGRMIVSDEPGTTRDVVEETVDLGGVALVLADTAGIRDAVGAAEGQAVARARETLEDADLRVLVLDASAQPDASDLGLFEELKERDTIVVWNKADLVGEVPREKLREFEGPGIEVATLSARTGQGCAEFAERLSSLAGRDREGEPVAISRIRHRAAVERALEPLNRAKALVISDRDCELAAADLREALAELAAVSEAVDNEEVLDRIFSEFCIGK